MKVDLVVAIGVFCSIGSFLIAYFIFGRSKKQDDKESGASVATITSDIGYVKSGIDGINIKLEKQDDRHIQIIQRVCNVETSVKSAHKRIDSIEEKENKE